jgi:uncharacterized protein (TIGR03437 family)
VVDGKKLGVHGQFEGDHRRNMFRLSIGFLSLALTATAATLPLYFEPNQGQAHSSVQYLSRGNGVTSYLAGNAAAFSVAGSSVIMRLAGASPGRPEALDRLPGVSSYFAASSRNRWRTGIPQFGKVVYRGVYPGIDLVYYGANGQLEYDFQIAPGADPDAIHIVYEGATDVRVDHGDVLLSTRGGQIRQRRPIVYQNITGSRRAVEASYRLDANHQVGLQLAAYDRTRPLVVDPVIEYATYFGGAGGDSANTVKVDASGNVYIAGTIAMPSPGANPFVPASISSYDSAAVVIKYSPSQKAILYIAQVGSDGQTDAGRMDVDAAGAIYLTGLTNSNNFPLVNAAVKTIRSGTYTPFVTKIAPDGRTVVFSTYFGGTGLDSFGGIVADPSGSAYVTGTAWARDFPVTDQGVDTTHGTQAYFAKFSSDGSLAFSRLFGGTTGSTEGHGVALDSSGNVYITGATSASDPPLKSAFQSSFVKNPLLGYMLPNNERSAFAAKFTSDGKTLVYSTLLGGSGDDAAMSAAVDSQGNLYLAGSTNSPDLPVLNAVQAQLGGIQNGFVAELNPQGNALVFSTYLGGSQKDAVQSLALDANGAIYVAGSATSLDFPALNATSTTKAKASAAMNVHNAFAAKLAPGGQGLVFSTLFGGSQDDFGYGITADTAGAAYLVGNSTSADLPVNNAFQASFGGKWDMFLAKLAPDAAPVPSIVALPASVHFTMVTGGATPAAQVINVAPANNGMPGTFTASASTASGGNWLSITKSAGSTPGQIGISVNPAGLGIGVYNGAIQITPSSGPSAVVPVVFRVIPVTPSLISVTPAQFDVAHFDVLNPPSTLPTVTLTVSGTGFVSGATAWVTTSLPWNATAYPTTLIDANTVQVALPLSVQATPVSITVANPGTPQSNPLNLMEGKPPIGAMSVVGTVVPGQTVTISGINIGPMALFLAPKDGPAVTTLGNTQVLFDGAPAQLVSAFFSQVRAIVPASVAGKTSTKIVVKCFDQSSAPLTVAVDGNAPPPDPLGPGVSAVLNPDASINSASNPASMGAVVTVLVDASQAPPGAVAPSSVTIGGVSAPIVPMTDVVTGHAGKMQFQVQVPSGVQTGSAVPVVVHFQNADATAQLSMAIQ